MSWGTIQNYDSAPNCLISLVDVLATDQLIIIIQILVHEHGGAWMFGTINATDLGSEYLEDRLHSIRTEKIYRVHVSYQLNAETAVF
jgi:hypothetical protein